MNKNTTPQKESEYVEPILTYIEAVNARDYVMVRTEKEMVYVGKDKEFAQSLVNKYNNHSALAKALQDMIDEADKTNGMIQFETLQNAKQVLHQAIN